jgi:hypothetical protein
MEIIRINVWRDTDDYEDMLSIRAEATVQFKEILQHITSGGLYDIDPNSTEEYLREIEEEAVIALIEELKIIGFTLEQIGKAPLTFMGRTK